MKKKSNSWHALRQPRQFLYSDGCVAERSLAGHSRTHRRVPQPVHDEPESDGDERSDHFLHHGVEVEGRAHQHEVPQQPEQRHRDERELDVQSQAAVADPQLPELFLGQVLERALVVEFVLAYHLADPFPPPHGARLLHDDEAAEDEEERVARDVEPVPPVAGAYARQLVDVPGRVHGAHAGRRLYEAEHRGRREPEDGADGQPRQVPPHQRPVAAAVHVAREEDKRADENQRPPPAELDEVDVENVGLLREVVPGEREEVAHEAADKQQKKVDRYLVRRVVEEDLTAHVHDDHQHHLLARGRFRYRSESTFLVGFGVAGRVDNATGRS